MNSYRVVLLPYHPCILKLMTHDDFFLSCMNWRGYCMIKHIPDETNNTSKTEKQSKQNLGSKNKKKGEQKHFPP